ncbi:hypothetical protein D3C78_1215630 [compost metagenome]
MANDNRIEPADAARTTSNSTIFVAFVTNQLTDFIILLRRERTITNASRVRLRNADYLLDFGWANARTDTYPACRRVRGCYERVSTLINIEHNALRALEQYLLSRINRIVKYNGCIRYIWTNLLRIAQIILNDLFCIKRLTAVNLLNQLVLFRDDAANASCKLL